ncbi:hypothetical protein BH23GEM6_BH23GEM6_02060 [soil metagenome]
MRSLLSLLILFSLTACGGFRTYTRATLAPLGDTFVCATNHLESMGYVVELRDSIGGVVQAQREITGITETARRGAAAATEVLTIGLAGGKRRRFDQITVLVYNQSFPQANAIDVTAGLLTTADDVHEQSPPTREARQDARRLAISCSSI